jgi:1-phosphofructokinase
VEGLGCRCVLDADGERLKYGLEAKPFMIKPNRYELETMIGRPLDGIADIREAALRYIDMGVQIAAVSLGAGGALITDGSETLFAPRMNIEVKGTVGAGDAMVAGLVAGFMADCELEQCFRMGVACASTRCITEGYKTIDKTVYKAFLDMVKIERI